MADVSTDLQSEADALADLVREREGKLLLPVCRAVSLHLAQLTRAARRVVHCVESGYVPIVPPVAASGLLGEVVEKWLAEHRKATRLLTEATGDVPWAGGPVRPSVVAAALLTEVFGRGQDIADALTLPLPRNDSIGHVAYYGVRMRDEAYLRHGWTPPTEPFRFELTAPSGILWEFGPADSAELITGPAEDFCLLVTGRRPAADLSLEASGILAPRWLDLVQSAPGPQWKSTMD